VKTAFEVSQIAELVESLILTLQEAEGVFGISQLYGDEAAYPMANQFVSLPVEYSILSAAILLLVQLIV